jgi:predicted ATPase
MALRAPRVRIDRVEIAGFKSIRKANLDLTPVSILIGANGAGKSNFASFFAMVAASLDETLNSFVTAHGGANAFLHQGARATNEISWQLEVSTAEGTGTIAQELAFKPPDYLSYVPMSGRIAAAANRSTTILNNICAVRTERGHHHSIKIFSGIKDGIGTYHFDDTSLRGPLRGPADITATLRLDGAGSNLPAILFEYEKAEEGLRLANPKSRYISGVFSRISRTVRKFFPGFDRFVLTPEADQQRILLRWRRRDSSHVYGPHQLSDGTLRAIALVTLLLQPKEDLPNLIVIDEPELGLHPLGVELIAGLIEAVSLSCQVIISTQSTILLDCFKAEQVVVVDEDKGASRFRRLDRRELAHWLKSYTISDLWQKNVIGGGPFP